MNKLSFSQKNDLGVKHKSKNYFNKDLELFQKHFPSNRLMNDLGNANKFTFERLDGQMLYLLLDKIPIAEILENSLEKTVEKQEEEFKKTETVTESPATQEPESTLRDELENRDTSIEELQKKTEDLEKKAFNKKKANRKNSPQ
jgi:predicted RNase H-like nuclease (RuvC/YqgF family)